MQTVGELEFLRLHPSGATTCSFHPKDRYLFISGGSDGRIRLTNALLRSQLRTVPLSALSLSKAINGLTFSCDGCKIFASCTSRRVSIVDAERGDVVISYENCANPTAGRQPLVTHESVPHLVACSTVNGRGITLLDMRMPLPLDFIFDLHEETIGDIAFLDESWPWSTGQVAFISAGSGALVKVSTLCGKTLHSFPSKQPVFTVASTPGQYVTGISKEFPNGSVSRYRRYPGHHVSLGKIVSHSGPVHDLSLSPYNEYLITASQDGNIGILHLGIPSHGWTQYCELT